MFVEMDQGNSCVTISNYLVLLMWIDPVFSLPGTPIHMLSAVALKKSVFSWTIHGKPRKILISSADVRSAFEHRSMRSYIENKHIYLLGSKITKNIIFLELELKPCLGFSRKFRIHKKVGGLRTLGEFRDLF